VIRPLSRNTKGRFRVTVPGTECYVLKVRLEVGHNSIPPRPLHGDTIVSHGPFIGDSKEDIYAEYCAGEFVRMTELARQDG
jgi:hypothetical protein